MCVPETVWFSHTIISLHCNGLIQVDHSQWSLRGEARGPGEKKNLIRGGIHILSMQILLLLKGVRYFNRAKCPLSDMYTLHNWASGASPPSRTTGVIIIVASSTSHAFAGTPTTCTYYIYSRVSRSESYVCQCSVAGVGNWWNCRHRRRQDAKYSAKKFVFIRQPSS